MICHISIDYDEGVPDSYRAVVLKCDNALRFESGDPQADWAEAMAFAKEHKLRLIEASSINHFVFDDIGWRFKEGEDGVEYLVPEDRPEWTEEIATAKKYKAALDSISVDDMLRAIEGQPHEVYWSLDKLAREMGVEQTEELDYIEDAEELREKFTTRWISQWMCSDTPVGSRAIYFEGMPLAIEHRQYRKSTPEYVFVRDAYTYNRAFNALREALLPKSIYKDLPKVDIDSPIPHRYIGYDEQEKFSDPIKNLLEERMNEIGEAPKGP